MVKHFCDRCKKEIDSIDRFSVRVEYAGTRILIPTGGLFDDLLLDLCFDCREEIEQRMKGDDD